MNVHRSRLDSRSRLAAVLAIAGAIVLATASPVLAGSYVGVVIPDGIRVGDTALPGGNYKVVVREDGDALRVRFRLGREVVAEARAVWESRDERISFNHVEPRTNGGGASEIAAIQFKDEARALVFRAGG